MPSYNIDREKYGLPAGANDPQYAAEKWALSKCMTHCREASKHFGAHVADLFAVVPEHLPEDMERCEALYGVVMEEKGVSKLVSVALNEAV